MNDTVIKIPWAKSVDEKLIHIHDAVKGQKYYCPCCNEQLTFKEGKSKKDTFHTEVTHNVILSLYITN
jgi:competence CoiA-like predicted nuclease